MSDKENPKAALIASSTWGITMASISPSFLISRARSTARIWLKTATDAKVKPVEAFAGSRTCNGESGSRTVDVIGATMVMALYRFEVSF